MGMGEGDGKRLEIEGELPKPRMYEESAFKPSSLKLI